MPNDPISPAHTAAIIKDLRAKRDELDRAIAVLEAMYPAPAAEAAAEQPATAAAERMTPSPLAAPKPVFNWGSAGIGDACVMVLKAYEGRTLATREVKDILLREGFDLKSSNPLNSVWNALDNRCKVKRDIHKTEGGWRYGPPGEKPQALSAETSRSQQWTAPGNSTAPYTHQ